MSEWQSSWTPSVGMRVVCIRRSDRWRCCTANDGRNAVEKPENGKIYTISAIWQFETDTGLQFDEIHCRTTVGSEAWFGKTQFRPLIKRKTDIAIFQAMLKDTRESIDA